MWQIPYAYTDSISTPNVQYQTGDRNCMAISGYIITFIIHLADKKIRDR
jgi:hypothetical protein